MMGPAAPKGLIDGLAALLRGERVGWSSLDVTPDRFLEVSHDQDLIGLVHRALRRQPELRGWPAELRDDIGRAAAAVAATEFVRQREVNAALDALEARGIQPILLKGTPLAYSVYQHPSLRPRSDTDLLIRREQVDRAREIMAGLGYTATNYSDGELIFRQFEVQKRDGFGLTHALDFHWQISVQAAFADLLSYDELAAEAIAVPALGPCALAAGAVHALLLACVHPAMHHRNLERLIWLYDVHLLAQRLRPGELDRFVALAADRRVATICAHELALAHARFGTAVPGEALARLARPVDEPSAAYLGPDRRWHHELASNLRSLTRWGDRLRLLREVAFPRPDYLLRAYGVSGGALAAALLPALYLHRGVRGVWKVVTGRK